MQRIRGRHQRVHDVLELVTEVLVPVSDPADPRLVEALEHLRRLLPDTPDPALTPQCGLDACRWAMPHPAAVRRHTSVIRNGEFTSPPPRRAVSWPSATTQPTSPTS